MMQILQIATNSPGLLDEFDDGPFTCISARLRAEFYDARVTARLLPIPWRYFFTKPAHRVSLAAESGGNKAARCNGPVAPFGDQSLNEWAEFFGPCFSGLNTPVQDKRTRKRTQ